MVAANTSHVNQNSLSSQNADSSHLHSSSSCSDYEDKSPVEKSGNLMKVKNFKPMDETYIVTRVDTGPTISYAIQSENVSGPGISTKVCFLDN